MMNNFELEKFIKEISQEVDEHYMLTVQKKITIFYTQFRLGETNVWFYSGGVLIIAVDRYIFENEKIEYEKSKEKRYLLW